MNGGNLLVWIFLLSGLVCLIMTVVIAGNKNRNVFLWLVLGFIITPFLSLIIVLGFDKKMSYDEQKAALQPVVVHSDTTSISDKLEKLFDLKTKGVLSEEEYQIQKTKLLK